MNFPSRYEAAWIPGLDSDLDMDEGLRLGADWLAAKERAFGKRGVIVMYAKSMADNRSTLAHAARRWQFVSPRSRRPADCGPVLAIWPPDAQVLELAEGLAQDSALCVIPGPVYEIGPWVRKAQAVCLVEGYEEGLATSELSPDVRRRLDDMLESDGHNSFVGSFGKVESIQYLKEIAALPARPSAPSIEGYLFASGMTDAEGAARARRWYEEILAGKQHRDYRGHTI